MARPPLEVADVFRVHGAEYLRSAKGAVSSAKRRVLAALEACRTAKLGGHVQECEDCGHQRVSYNSCRNRHCPKCQGQARADWLDARKADLLPVEYSTSSSRCRRRSRRSRCKTRRRCTAS